MGTGEFTLAPSPGLLIDRGKPQRAAAGGSGAGGTSAVLAGGFGVIGQLVTFLVIPGILPGRPKRVLTQYRPLSRRRVRHGDGVPYFAFHPRSAYPSVRRPAAL